MRWPRRQQLVNPTSASSRSLPSTTVKRSSDSDSGSDRQASHGATKVVAVDWSQMTCRSVGASYAAARSANFANRFMNESFTVPVGPFRCFERWISARPCWSVSSGL
jgi:hypothetical protein